MNKVKFHYGNNPVPFDVDTEKDVDVYIDEFNRNPIHNGNIRIVVLEEPRKNYIYRVMKANPHRYTYLLTFHEELLGMSPRIRRFLMMNVWMKDYVPKEKRFSVSTVVGGKNDTLMKGYELRHELWRNRDRITIPKEFYLSGSAKNFHTFVPWTEVDYTNELVLGDTKKPLFDSMYHIAIENTSIKNYFSEKLLDCFQTKTIPIYYGCTNIGEYFNTKGIFEAKDIDQIIEWCNGLTPELYYDLLPVIEENYQKSMEWCNPKKQLEDKVRELINE